MIIAVPEYFAAPTGPSVWDLYYDTAQDKVFVWDGSAWQEITEEARVRDSDRLGLTLNRVRYAGQDFGTIFDEIQAYLQENYPDDWKDMLFSNGGVSHLAYAAYLGQGLAWYQNRRATDGYLATAISGTSVALWAGYLGYKVRGAAAAATDLEVSIPQSPTAYGFPVVIPRGHVFYGPDDMTYLSVADVVFTGAQTTKTVSVAEGVAVTESFVSTGETNQIFNLQTPPDGQFIAQGTVTVTVDAGLWPVYDFLPQGNVVAAEVGYTSDPPTVRFGDGIIGKVPRYSAGIVVSYELCSGKAGKIAKDGITSADDLVIGGVAIALTVSQPDPAVGGDDPESIVSVKANAPRTFATGKRAVTALDFVTSVVGYPTRAGVVSKATAVVPRTLGEDTTVRLAMLDLNEDLVGLLAQGVVLGAAQAGVEAGAAALTSDLAELETPLATIDVYSALITTRLAEITTYLAGLSTARTALVDTVTRLQDGLSALDAALIQINGLVSSASADPTSPIYLEAVKVQVATLINQTRSMFTSSTGVDGSLSAERAILLQQVALLAAIELNRARINQSCFDAVQGVQACNTAVAVQKAQMDLSSATMETTIADISDQALHLSAAKDEIAAHRASMWSYLAMTRDSLGRYEGALAAHLDGLFALNCGSNVVQIPCLTKDRDGFYAAPSQALLDAVQARLDSLKLLEVSARPINGAVALIEVTVNVWLYADEDYVEDDIRTEAVSRIEDLLKGRDFGAVLHKWDVARLLVPPDDSIPAIAGIEGVRWGEVQLLVPADRARVVAGNVVPGALGVVTKGAVNVTVRSAQEA